MSQSPVPDPSAFFQQMLTQWESMANQYGGEMLKTGEFAQAMHGATTATANAQAAMNQMMERALAAANMPSRSEVEDVSARLRRVEDTVLRIEAMLRAKNGEKVAEAVPGMSTLRPKLARTRTAPDKPGKKA